MSEQAPHPLTLLWGLLEQATPGPWKRESYPQHISDPSGAVIVYDEGAPNDADAALIVAMRNALPALLDVLEHPPEPVCPICFGPLIDCGMFDGASKCETDSDHWAGYLDADTQRAANLKALTAALDTPGAG